MNGPRIDAAEVKARVSCSDVLSRHGIPWAGADIKCPLPGHDDNRPSFGLFEGGKAFKCHGCGRGGDAISLHRELTGQDFTTALETMAGWVGLSPDTTPKPFGKIVETYDYTDEAGNLLFQVCRMDPKDFRQRAPSGSGWTWKTKGIRRVLYRIRDVLDAVKESRAVYLVEGEKDAHALEALGLCATCNPGGAGKWLADYGDTLRGADVVILLDKDEPGRDHAAKVAKALHGTARRVRVLELPDRNGTPVKDAADWCAAGGTASELSALVDAAPDYTAPAQPAQADTPRKVEAERPPPQALEPWDEPAPLGGWESDCAPFPLDTLPGSIRAMVEAVRDTYRQPPDMIAAAALGVLSIATRNRFRVEIKQDHRTETNLYALIVLPPGGGKTPVLKSLAAPLYDWQREALEAWEPIRKDYARRAGIVESKIKGLRRSCEKLDAQADEMEGARREIERLENELGPPPPAPILYTSDATSEALSRLMGGNGGFAAVLSSEARKMLAVAKGRYAEGGDVDLWLAGHAGDPVRIDRRNGEPVNLDHPTLAALLMTQPDSLADLGTVPAMRESGFLARWLYVCPDTVPSPYNVQSVPLDVKERYARTIRAALAMPPAQGRNGEPLPHLLRLDPAALRAWVAFHDDTAQRIAKGAETMPALIAQWESKLPVHIVRIAGLFRIARHIENGEPLNVVTAQDMAAALAFVPALRSHAARAVEGIGSNPETARARKVWQWLDKNRATLRDLRDREALGPVEAVKPRDLDRAGVAGIGNATEATAVLDLLASKGWVQALTFKREGTTAKGAPLYYVRPVEVSKIPHPTIPTNPTILPEKAPEAEESRESRESRVPLHEKHEPPPPPPVEVETDSELADYAAFF